MSVQLRQIKKTIDLFRHFTLILHAFKFFTATKKKKKKVCLECKFLGVVKICDF